MKTKHEKIVLKTIGYFLLISPIATLFAFATIKLGWDFVEIVLISLAIVAIMIIGVYFIIKTEDEDIS